jgi:hypothetical protein
MAQPRFLLGVLVLLTGVVVLGALDARYWPFPLFMVGLAPFLILGGHLIGLNEEHPPWRRRGHR